MTQFYNLISPQVECFSVFNTIEDNIPLYYFPGDEVLKQLVWLFIKSQFSSAAHYGGLRFSDFPSYFHWVYKFTPLLITFVLYYRPVQPWVWIQ